MGLDREERGELEEEACAEGVFGVVEGCVGGGVYESAEAATADATVEGPEGGLLEEGVLGRGEVGCS